jgi:dienelactone hydrolase
MRHRSSAFGFIVIAAALLPAVSAAQGTAADYERAATVAERTEGLVVDLAEAPHWIEGNRFWYVAAKYPSYDISRVGIYGGSAGGQSSTGALLFHPEFYKVAVSFAGCHDNRMDKIWWNEQWMGWPIGPQYAKSSNVDNASRLQGKLLMLVGELDENVDPASTFQVANALIKANKSFDLFVFPGGDHGVGRRGRLTSYGNNKQWDYFVHQLLGVEPPNRNAPAAGGTARPSSGGPGVDDAPHGSIFAESWPPIESRWGK